MADRAEVEVIRVGSRKSELALVQTHYVISLLKKLNPSKEFEIVTMSTLGDRVLNISLPKIGEKSLFTKDLEEALENGSVDLVVHSLKDLPTSLPCGMAIGAVLEREDPRDALVLRQDFKGHTLETLPKGSIIGTSSLRRTAQLSRNYPHLKVLDIRGNLNTRLRKLDHNCRTSNDEDSKNGNCDANGNGSINDAGKDFSTYPDYAAIMLAQAGLVRMGWQHRVSQVLPCKDVLYAVGQGALAVECRANNHKILEMLSPLNHDVTYCRILAERSFLKTLGGGCSAPVAISTSFNKEKDIAKSQLDITGAVWSLDGKTEIQKSLVLNFETTEWHKAKHGKHKLSDAIEISDNSKVPKKACMGLEDKQEENNEVAKPLCCRQKTINMTMEKAEPVEIENLINIHGKLFMSCPFSGQKGACPVKLEIGADFMGECPYQGARDKGIDEDIKNTLVKLHPKRISYDIKKCPFMSNQIAPANSQTECVNTINLDVKSECPFIKENLPKSSDNRTSSDTENLYCGLTKHFDLPVDVIEKCEDLGKRLAQALIDEGALDVMKCSQDFIRGSVAASAINA